MKIDHKIKNKKCSKEGLCDFLSEAIFSINGSKRGFSRFLSINGRALVGGADVTSRIGFVFNPNAIKDEIGILMIEFCPFCGAKFNSGTPIEELTS